VCIVSRVVKCTYHGYPISDLFSTLCFGKFSHRFHKTFSDESWRLFSCARIRNEYLHVPKEVLKRFRKTPDFGTRIRICVKQMLYRLAASAIAWCVRRRRVKSSFLCGRIKSIRYAQPRPVSSRTYSLR